MMAFYDQLERLRDSLAHGGLDGWARELLAAERSASTSGEAIDNTSVVLRKLLASDELSDNELREEVKAALGEGTRLWHS
jgi:hypothetical protein